MNHITLRHMRTRAIFLVALLTALAIAALSLGLKHLQAQSAPAETSPVVVEARVNVSSLNLRTGPHVSYTAVAYLMDGERVRLVGRNRAGTWAQVELYNGYRGWVNARYLQAGVNIAALPVVDVSLLGITAFVANDPILLHAGPDALYQRVATAEPGETLALTGRNDAATWVLAQLPDGRAGWVRADSPFLPSAALNDLPIITPFLDAPPPDLAAFYRLYVGPGFLYEPVDLVTEGQTLGIRGRTADARWVLVRLDSGREGWIAAEIIQAAVPLEAVPVIEGVAPPQVVGWQVGGGGSAPAATATATAEPTGTTGGKPGGQGLATAAATPTAAATATERATAQPTERPTQEPTEQPTERPTLPPTAPPTERPTEQATARATSTRPATPTPAPTMTPAATATDEPTVTATSVATVEATATTAAQATTDGPPAGQPVVYVYATPSDDNAPILRVVPGQSVVLIGRTADSEWIQIWLPGDQQGWIRASAVEVEIDLSVLPVVEP